MTAEELYMKRLNRVNTALSLGVPDRVPVIPHIASYTQRACGSDYEDLFYNYEKAEAAQIMFYKDHPAMDANTFNGYQCGKADELAGIELIDWPGRPGGKVGRYSSHQVIERELLLQEEYPEMLRDFTGFMLTKALPRAFRNLQGLKGLTLSPTAIMSTEVFSSFYSPQAQEAFRLIGQIGEEEQKKSAASMRLIKSMAEMGFPPLFTGMSLCPYDILGDYFRGTMGIFEDITDDETVEYVEQACWMFADQQIRKLSYLKDSPLPVKRVFFPMHKGMDGFMSEKQYEKLYWKPLKKIVLALIDMGVTPYLYTEGPYNSRLEQLTDVPKGKVWYHFEDVDMKKAKQVFGGIACISGNLSITTMEFGSAEQVREDVKRLLDQCAPGGGYMFDFNGSLENCKPENLEAMFDTLETYGKY